MATNGKPTTNGKPGRAVRAARREVARAERAAAEKSKQAEREFAREHLRRELAVWLMAWRTKFDELFVSFERVYYANDREGGLLAGLIEDGPLREVFCNLSQVDNALLSLKVECGELNDPIEAAASYAENWGCDRTRRGNAQATVGPRVQPLDPGTDGGQNDAR